VTEPDSGADETTVALEGRAVRVRCGRPATRLFWAHVAAGAWEEDLVAFLRRHVRAGVVFIDVGAWIGAVSLMASARGASVIAIEPDPVAFADLAANVALNDAAIDARHAAIDVAPGEMTLFASHAFGASETSALDRTGAPMTVGAIAFADLDAAIPAGASTVVKIDVEGHEYALADALSAFAAKHRAALHLSLHPAILCRARRGAAGPLAARVATFAATRRLVATLARTHRVTLSAGGGAVGALRLFLYVFVRRRPKNFSVAAIPR
jgi:FkbM family methyltransferase